MPIIYCYVVEEKYISVMQKIHIMGYSESESEKSVSYSIVSLYSSSLSKASAPSFGIRKKVSVSVSENLVSEKKSRFRFQNFWSRKKSIGFGIGIFGIGKKSLGIGFGKFVIGKKVLVLVSVKILVLSFSDPYGMCGLVNQHQIL